MPASGAAAAFCRFASRADGTEHPTTLPKTGSHLSQSWTRVRTGGRATRVRHGLAVVSRHGDVVV
jgi:hypothetical protein